MTQSNNADSDWQHIKDTACAIAVTEKSAEPVFDTPITLGKGDQAMFTDSVLKVIPAGGNVATTYSEPEYSWTLRYTDTEGIHRRYASVYRPESHDATLCALLERVVDAGIYKPVAKQCGDEGRAVVALTNTNLEVSVDRKLMEEVSEGSHDGLPALAEKLTEQLQSTISNSVYFYIVRDHAYIVDTLRRRAKSAYKHSTAVGGDGSVSTNTQTVILLDSVGGSIQAAIMTQFLEDFVN